MRFSHFITTTFAFCLTIFTATGWALDVQLDEQRPTLETIHDGHVVKVERIQALDHTISGFFSRTAHKCPPHCAQPMSIAPGVKTVGELDVFDFLEKDVVTAEGVLVDARLPEWNQKGTIPGSINIPFTIFEKSATDEQLVDTLYKLGVRQRGEVGLATHAMETLGLLNVDLKNDEWDFSQAKRLILFCNGSGCGQSPRAIRALLKLGYPADRLAYYRGGMQRWQLYGLTTIVP
jgi:rhodanese-related sulfurtransferase